MNILYLSHLSGASYAGPTYSVPKQIEAQSRFDNVFWYNAVENDKEEWHDFPFYHNKKEFPAGTISSLPEPFNHPDIVVVELFYNMTGCKLQRELLSSKYKYIIIPRGELTKQAQTRKALKKAIANYLVCKRFARKAAAIQYLTEQEYRDSGGSWNKNHFIIPNGINLPEKTKCTFSQDTVKCISIGRIEPYQKGLDMLIEACSEMKEALEKANCSITICGPDNEGKVAELKHIVDVQGLDKIFLFRDGAYGKEKEELLLKHDVFLIPSRFEGHPMALIEALSYGLPCIATTGSNMRKEIEEYNAGWTADNTVEGIKNGIQNMLIEKENYSDKSSRALELAKQYEWQSLAMKAHNLFSLLR